MGITFPAFINICLGFWSCANFLCMASSSPYSGMVKYLLTFGFSATFFWIISSFSNSRTVSRLCNAIFLINLLLIVYLIKIGSPYRGVRRWIFINGFSYQPSEFLKISFPVVFSQLFSSKNWLGAIFLCFSLLFLLLLQPDIGNSILLFIVSLTIAFFWGVRKRFLLPFMLLGCAFLAFSSLKVSYSSKRIKSFIHYGNANLSYQSFRAIQAIESGKLTGTGPGKGTIKRFIPDAYSDFIFAVIGEEFGFIGCLLIATSFLLFFLSCIIFSSVNPTSVEGSSIFGIGMIIFLQAWIHMASVLAIIPTKGITLPFISHGSSSMMASWVGLAVILAMSKSIKPYQKLDNVIT